MHGWISLHRKFQKNALWQEPRVFSKAEAWLDILMEVQYSKEQSEVVMKNTIITCDRGQSVKSIQTWAERWTWSRSAIQRFFALLKRQGMITTENLTKTIRLTVCNYSTYQDLRTEDDLKVIRKRFEGDLNPDTDNKVNKENKGNKDNKTTLADEIKDYWNGKGNLANVRMLTPTRKSQINTRLKEKEFSENWRKIINMVSDSPFLSGESGKWKAGFDWIIKNSGNYTKVLEGNYDNGKTIQPGQRQFNEEEATGSAYGVSVSNE